MTGEVMALGLYVRFPHVSLIDVLSPFYAHALGLPQPLRWRRPKGDPEDKDYWWGGEAIIVDHNYGGGAVPVSPREADPATARQMEIYRVSDLDGVLRRLNDRGVSTVPIRPCFHGREAFVLDPMGMLIGLRQRNESSPLPQDREGLRRRVRGEAFNPGCKQMPEGWQEIGWVRLTVGDLPGAIRFYRDIIGLPFIAEAQGCALLDLGDNTTLELAPGGEPRNPPKRQMDSLACIILRVTDVNAMVGRLKAAGVHFVHDMLTSPKGSWTYVSDPEGNVVGLSQRVHPAAYCDALDVRPEDIEGARRWAEAKAGARN